jgi:hypothetical protein
MRGIGGDIIEFLPRKYGRMGQVDSAELWDENF